MWLIGITLVPSVSGMNSDPWYTIFFSIKASLLSLESIVDEKISLYDRIPTGYFPQQIDRMRQLSVFTIDSVNARRVGLTTHVCFTRKSLKLLWCI